MTESDSATERDDLSLYDAFVSHSSADRKQVSRIQAFLESYSFGKPKRRVKVFRDISDLPAGELAHELEVALEQSRFLVVVSSPSAAESKWVEKEILQFDQIHEDSTKIGVAVLDGSVDTEMIDALSDREYLRHDLTKGWIFGIPRLQTRLGLLRILSAVTGQPMRGLVKWHLLRTAKNWFLATLIALIPFVLYMIQSVSIWQKMDINTARGPVYAIWSEVVNGSELKVASRFRGQGPQGFRNYFSVISNVFDTDRQGAIQHEFSSSRRALPLYLNDHETRAQSSQRLRVASVTDRSPAGEPFVGSPQSGFYVVVQPLALTDEEEGQANDDMVDFGFPIPSSNGSVIATISPAGTKLSLVKQLNPFWSNLDRTDNPTSPAMTPPFVWDDDLGIWIGFPGWDVRSEGGLWRSLDNGESWQQVDGFKSVNSIGVMQRNGSKCIVVTELHFDAWEGILLVPYPSRALVSCDGGETWTTADTPPFGSRSEIEYVGALPSEQTVFRVDENLFIREEVQRWKRVF